MTTEHNEIVENEAYNNGTSKAAEDAPTDAGAENAPVGSEKTPDADGHHHHHAHEHHHHDHHHDHGHDHEHDGHEHDGLEELEPSLVFNFTVEVSKEKIAESFDAKINQYASDVRMPGFRKGKAPMDVVKAKLKDAVMDEVIGQLLQNAIFEKLQQDKIKAISKPQVKKIDHPEGQDMKAEIDIETLPVFDIPDLDTIQVEVPAAQSAEIEPFDEEKAIERLRQNQQRQVPVGDRPAGEGDMIMIEYQSKFLDSKRLTPKKSSYYYVRQDGSHEINGLYDDILGKQTGEQFTVVREYPADYSKKSWAGKKIEHFVHVKTIYEMKLPELDETFLKGLGHQNEEELRAKLRSDYDEYKKQNSNRKTLDIILNKLVETVQFPVPKSMLRQEIAHMIQQNPYLFNPGKDKETFQRIYLSLQSRAENGIRLSLISDAIAEKYQIKVTMEDYEAEYKKIAEANRLDVKEVRKYYLKKEHQQYLEDTLQRTKILDFIKEKVQVKEV